MSQTRTSQYSDLGCPMVRESHDDSTAEARESLMGKDNGQSWSEERRDGFGIRRGWASRSQRIWLRISSFRWLLDVVLGLIIVGLLLDMRYHRTIYGQFEGAGDLTGFAPKMSQQIKGFAPNPAFVPENGSEFFTQAVQDKWLSVVPKGLGYVKVNDPENYNNLPTPLVGYSANTFTTSMTHQLHCLYAIVSNYASMTSKSTEKPHEEAWHLTHCFDYLRQSIMCCGDMALEGTQTTFPEGSIGSDGWDAKHVCKDYNQVLGHLEKQRANDDVWI